MLDESAKKVSGRLEDWGEWMDGEYVDGPEHLYQGERHTSGACDVSAGSSSSCCVIRRTWLINSPIAHY